MWGRTTIRLLLPSRASSGVGGAACRQALYPSPTRLLITADAGGSNGYRLRLWKLELQKLADETGLEIALPPPTRDQQVEQDRTPLVLRDQSELARKAAGSHEVVVNLIGATTTRTGLQVQSQAGHQPIPGRAHRIGRRTRSHLFA